MSSPGIGTSWRDLVIGAVTDRVLGEVHKHRCVLVYGPPGFGKTRLHDGLVREYSAKRVDHDDDRFDPGLLWQLTWTTSDGAEAIVGASRRRLHRRDTAVIGPDTLAIDRTDLPLDTPGHIAAALVDAVGWPDFVVDVLGQETPDEPLSPAASRRREEFVFRCTQDAAEPLLGALAALTRFRRFTPEMLSALGPTFTVSEAQRVGVPLIEANDGWLTILEPVRTALHDRIDCLDRQTAEELRQPALAALGPVATLEAFVNAGRTDTAAEVVATLSRRELAGVDTMRWIALLRLLVECHPDNGRLFFSLAEANDWVAQFAEQRANLRSARLAAEASGDQALCAEIDAEALLLDQPSLELEEVAERLAALQERSAGVATTTMTIRLKEIAALMLAQSPVLADVHEAANELELIANQWEFVDERNRAGRTIRKLCAVCLTHLGEYAKAVALLDRAAVLVKDQPDQLQRTNQLSMLMSARQADTENFVDRRDLDIALMSRVESVGWIEAYRSWAEMICAAFNSSAQRVRQAYYEANARLGELQHTSTGAYLLTEAAVAAAIAGDESLARESVEAHQSHALPHALEGFLAEVAVEARFGTAESFANALSGGRDLEIPAARAWRVDLCRHIHAQRLGLESPTDASSTMADAQRFGLGALAQRLLESSGLHNKDSPTRVEVLGELRVVVAGEEVSLPPGKVSELLKLLAVRDRQVPLEVVVDHLWPEADLDRGRARLRNCVNRLRSLLGPDSVVRAGDAVSLSSDIDVDLREFWIDVSALEVDPSASGRIAKLYRGNLLEADLYADWLQPEREATRNAMERALDNGLDTGVISDQQATAVRLCLDRLD